MSTMTLQELKDDCFNDLQEKVQDDFKEYINSNYLKDLFFNTDDFIEEYEDRFDDLKSDYSNEIADNNIPIYYSDLYSVFNDSPHKIDNNYNDFINDFGKENSGESISDCIKKGIYYTLEREVYNIELNDILTNDFIEELKEEYKSNLIDELLEEAQETYEEITEEDIIIFIDEYNNIDDLDNYVLNIKLNKKLEEKNTSNKIVKI